MCSVLLSLRQWDVVAGTVLSLRPADADHPTPEESKAQEAWEVREISAFMEISFRVADSAKSVLGDTQNPKVAWDILAKRFGAKQEGLQSTLISKLQLASWGGTGAIHIHRDYMADLRIQLAGAGMILSDPAFYSYFIESLPPALDLFVTLYEDTNHDVDFLCGKFAKYEMRLKLRAAKSGKDEASGSGSVVTFGQQPADKEEENKGRKDISNTACYGRGKTGYFSANCPDKQEKRDEKSKSGKEGEKSELSASKKSPIGVLYTAMPHAGLVANRDLTKTFYVGSGASYHLVPSRGELRAYKEFAAAVEIAAVNNGKIYAQGTGTLRVTASVNGMEREADLEDVYYAPGVHVRLVSLGKLESQGWGICLQNGGMELKNRDGDVFTNVKKVNNVYPMGVRVMLGHHNLQAKRAL